MSDIWIIVQARMGSTRLPGKILKEILGKSLLELEIERLRDSVLGDRILVATTTNELDKATIEWCSKMKIPFYRGSEEDVLSRYAGAAHQVKADAVVRVTADCPLIDPEVLDQMCERFEAEDSDYFSNTIERTFPRGLDLELFKSSALFQANEEARLPYEREHVTPFLKNPGRFRVASFTGPKNHSDLRWTVDTSEDFQLIKLIFEALYPNDKKFRYQTILDLLEQNPEWKKINAHIEQKKN